MKQKSIFALVLGAILVFSLSGTETAFADYDGYNDDKDDGHDKENDRDDDRNESNDQYDNDRDDDDKSERERRR